MIFNLVLSALRPPLFSLLLFFLSLVEGLGEMTDQFLPWSVDLKNILSCDVEVFYFFAPQTIGLFQFQRNFSGSCLLRFNIIRFKCTQINAQNFHPDFQYIRCLIRRSERSKIHHPVYGFPISISDTGFALWPHPRTHCLAVRRNAKRISLSMATW